MRNWEFSNGRVTIITKVKGQPCWNSA